MKIAALIAGILLGLLFVMSASVVLFKLVPIPEPPAGTPNATFMAAFVPTGYMTFVKVFELLGGILVAIPKTRNLGLLCLGPIIVNIFAFHQLVAGDGVFQLMLLGIAALSLFLLWVERSAWKALVVRA
jgi:putative oxidoreductase